MTKQSEKKINEIVLFDSRGKKSGNVELDKNTFNGKINKSLLYQALAMYRANQRRGTASTKNRGEVRGSGRKPWRQKGTGRARVGSVRNPVWRSGGIAFGPRPRDFRYNMPGKAKQNAFISSLNAKLAGGKIAALENVSIDAPKTKKVATLIKGLKVPARMLFLVREIDRNLGLASRNLKNVTLRKVNEATALDVMSSESVVITKQAADFLNETVK